MTLIYEKRGGFAALPSVKKTFIYDES